MAEEREHVWLSQARRYAERQAAGQTTLASRGLATIRAVRLSLGEWAGGGGGIFFTILVLVVMHVIFLVVPKIRGVPNAEDGREFLFVLWQVSAAVIGIAFVLLILIVGTIHRSVQGEYLWQRFARSSNLFMTTVFLLCTILAIGAGALWLLPSTGDGLGASSRLTNLVALDIVLFALSLAALLWLYRNVFRFLNPGFLHRLATDSLSATVRAAVSREFLSRIENHILRLECNALGLFYDPGATHWGQMEPARVHDEGIVIDVNLREVRKLASVLMSTTEPRAIVALGPGQRVTRDRNAAIFVRQEDHSERTTALAGRCFRIARQRQERGRDLQEAFSVLTEQALRAIESGRQEQFRSVLDALREPVRVALETLRSYGMVFDPETARNIFSFEWPPLERPFREYERIVEAAARSGDARIVLEAAYWPYSVMRLSVEERDHFFYREAVRYLPYLYHLSAVEASPRIKTLLAHRAWSHLQDFGRYEITSRARDTQDAELVDGLRSYGAELLAALANLLRTAIDAGDRTYFTEAARGFWQAIDVQFASAAIGLTLDLTQREPVIGTAHGLRRAKAEFLLYIADRRDALWFALGAWVCHRWATAALSPDLAREVFEQLAEPFRDFRRLWRAFNAALSAESADRLPLSNWEMAEHPPGQVISLRPEAHLALFFTLLALTNIPDRIHDRISSLATLAQASWAKTQVTAALEQIRSSPERWVSLIGDTERQDEEKEIAALMDAAEEDEKRRERLQIIEQKLSPSKLAEFKADFLEAWASSGLMRRLLEGVNSVEYGREDPPDLRLLGLRHLVPKGAFVDETGGTHWWGVGRRFGEAMADGENRRAYEAIRKRARPHRMGSQTIAQKLSEMAERLERTGPVPDVILFTGDWGILQRLDGAAEYVPWYVSADDRPPQFQGTFKGIPIYMLHVSDEPEFLLVSLRSVGRLVQYLSEDDSVFRRFEVKDYPLESARKAVAGDRSWLPVDVRKLPDDALIEYLREHVSVRIEQALEMRIDNKLAARRLTVPPQENLPAA